MKRRKIYKYEKHDIISSLRTVNILPGNLVVAGCFQKIFKVCEMSNNIQIPGMVFRDNAGLPILSLNFLNQRKTYKLQEINAINMIPGDRNGSPDESFFFKSYIRGGIN